MLERAQNIVKSVEDNYGSGLVEQAFQDLLHIIQTQDKALDIYKRERDRFKHNYPEITGEYFLAGGHGEVDDNLLPQFVSIVPAYGCAWEQVYEKTDRTFSLEGS